LSCIEPSKESISFGHLRLHQCGWWESQVGSKGLTLKTHTLVDLGVSTLGLNWLLFEVDACFLNSSHSFSKNCKTSFLFETNELSLNFIEMRAWSL
jgi:hypothetical protein